MSSFSTQFTVPEGDVIAYLQGCWKRSLEWRHFGGGYQHLGTSNTIIAIEEEQAAAGQVGQVGQAAVVAAAAAAAAQQQQQQPQPQQQPQRQEEGASLAAPVPSRRMSVDESRFLRWSFGGTMGPSRNDMTEGYVMKFIPDRSGTYMEWEHSGMRCHGHFDPGTSVITLNFNLKSSKVTATYHAMDANTMAVCLIEVGSSLVPTLQYGNMHRVRPDAR
jgi:hypothetical protein